MVNICDLTDDHLNETLRGQHPEMVVEFSAQTKIPLILFLKGDLFHLAQEEADSGRVEIMQTFYVRSGGQELLFSSDLIAWKPFLEFITGNTSVGLSLREGKPSIVLGAEANKRTQ